MEEMQRCLSTLHKIRRYIMVLLLLVLLLLLYYVICPLKTISNLCRSHGFFFENGKRKKKRNSIDMSPGGGGCMTNQWDRIKGTPSQGLDVMFFISMCH